MGNLYNIQQVSVPVQSAQAINVSKVGLEQWKNEVRKQVMEKLKGYSPEHVDKIIKHTFGDLHI